MASGGFFRGTSLEQDSRYFNQNKKLLAKMKFPSNFDQKVSMKKVNQEVINVWITEKLNEILGFEDEIVTSMTINLLENHNNHMENLDPKQLQVQLTGFLEQRAGPFMEELWNLLLSAQNNPTGIPTEFLEKKKKELQQKREEDARKSQLIKKRIESIRQDGESSRSSNRRSNRPRSRSRSQGKNDRDRRESSRIGQSKSPTGSEGNGKESFERVRSNSPRKSNRERRNSSRRSRSKSPKGSDIDQKNLSQRSRRKELRQRSSSNEKKVDMFGRRKRSTSGSRSHERSRRRRRRKSLSRSRSPRNTYQRSRQKSPKSKRKRSMSSRSRSFSVSTSPPRRDQSLKRKSSSKKNIQQSNDNQSQGLSQLTQYEEDLENSK